MSEIMDRVKAHGFDWRENSRVGKSSISSTCGHDAVFLRLGAGHFTLRALPRAFDHIHPTASRSRQELEVCSVPVLAPCSRRPVYDALSMTPCLHRAVYDAPSTSVCVYFGSRLRFLSAVPVHGHYI